MKRILTLAAMLGLMAAILIPASALAWVGGETQTEVHEYTLTVAGGETVPDTGVIHDQWTYTVTNPAMTSVSLPCGPGLTGNFWKQEGAIVPLDYTWNWPVGNAACREAYAYGNASTAAIVSAILYADNTDGRALAQVSTQKLFGGGATNTAVVYYTYGGGYPVPPFTVTMQTQATLMGCTGWTDVFNVYPTGAPSTCPGGACCLPGAKYVTLQWDWVSSTNTNLPASAQPPKAAAMVTDVCVNNITLAPLRQVDSYHFVKTDTAVCTGGNPTPCIPEIATFTLAGVGLLSIVGFVWFRRRQASAA